MAVVSRFQRGVGPQRGTGPQRDAGPRRGPDSPSIVDLQQRVQRMQGGAVTRTLPSLPAMAPVLRLRTGGTYAVDSPSVALALLAGPSQAGEWCAVVGAPELGLEAAAHLGVDLARTVLVPRPGEHWLSAAAGLLDVAGVVLVKPPVAVSEHQAARLKARLRQKDAALVCWGEWPRCDATVSVTSSAWTGLGDGHGHLTGRRVVVSVRQAGPVRQVPLWLPGPDRQVVPAEPVVAPLAAVRAG